MPLLETVPSSALFLSKDGNQHGLKAEYFNTADFNGHAYIGQAFVTEAMRKAVKVPMDPKPLFTRVDQQVDRAPLIVPDPVRYSVFW